MHCSEQLALSFSQNNKPKPQQLSADTSDQEILRSKGKELLDRMDESQVRNE